jgi:hypothetical protein
LLKGDFIVRRLSRFPQRQAARRPGVEVLEDRQLLFGLGLLSSTSLLPLPVVELAPGLRAPVLAGTQPPGASTSSPTSDKAGPVLGLDRLSSGVGLSVEAHLGGVAGLGLGITQGSPSSSGGNLLNLNVAVGGSSLLPLGAQADLGTGTAGLHLAVNTGSSGGNGTEMHTTTSAGVDTGSGLIPNSGVSGTINASINGGPSVAVGGGLHLSIPSGSTNNPPAAPGLDVCLNVGLVGKGSSTETSPEKGPAIDLRGSASVPSATGPDLAVTRLFGAGPLPKGAQQTVPLVFPAAGELPQAVLLALPATAKGPEIPREEILWFVKVGRDERLSGGRGEELGGEGGEGGGADGRSAETHLEPLTPMGSDLLGDAAPFDTADLERAVQEFLGQLADLHQSLSVWVTLQGPFLWYCLGATLAALAQRVVRRRERQARLVGLSGMEGAAAPLWLPDPFHSGDWMT